MRLKEHWKGWASRAQGFGVFMQIYKKQEFLEILKLGKRWIPLKKEQFTLKCQKTCLKN